MWVRNLSPPGRSFVLLRCYLQRVPVQGGRGGGVYPVASRTVLLMIDCPGALGLPEHGYRPIFTFAVVVSVLRPGAFTRTSSRALSGR